MRKIVRPECPNSRALKTDYKNAENKKALENASFGKCMYCESHVAHVYFGDVEHIRPKAADKFLELQFEWSNLGYCCSRCNNAKRDQFDINCPLIDPYSDDPDMHLLAFGSTVHQKAGSERGAITILTVDLNRAELVERRAMRLQAVQSAIDACYRTSNGAVRDVLMQALLEEGAADKEFSLFTSALLAANAVV